MRPFVGYSPTLHYLDSWGHHLHNIKWELRPSPCRTIHHGPWNRANDRCCSYLSCRGSTPKYSWTVHLHLLWLCLFGDYVGIFRQLGNLTPYLQQHLETVGGCDYSPHNIRWLNHNWKLFRL